MQAKQPPRGGLGHTEVPWKMNDLRYSTKPLLHPKCDFHIRWKAVLQKLILTPIFCTAYNPEDVLLHWEGEFHNKSGSLLENP